MKRDLDTEHTIDIKVAIIPGGSLTGKRIGIVEDLAWKMGMKVLDLEALRTELSSKR